MARVDLGELLLHGAGDRAEPDRVQPEVRIVAPDRSAEAATSTTWSGPFCSTAWSTAAWKPRS